MGKNMLLGHDFCNLCVALTAMGRDLLFGGQ